MNKFIAILILAVGSIACSDRVPHERYTDFNFGWKFVLSDNDMFSEPEFDDSEWRELRLPHDWSIEADFDESLNGATAYLPGGVGWYRKTFATPVDTDNKVVYLYFDGIYNHSTVWINGKEIGGRVNGYTPFYLDVSEFLNDDGAENLIAVRVDRTRYIDSRWYTGSGIYRDVELIVADKLHILPWGTFVKTPEVGPLRAEVQLEVNLFNATNDEQVVDLETVILDPGGTEVSRQKQQFKVGQDNGHLAQQHFSIDTPALWDIEAPNMYMAVTMLFRDGNIVDQYKTKFGIRSIRYDPGNGFFLNGRNVKIKGVNLHHEAGLVGAAVPDDVWRRRLQALKAAGTNAIRTAHNPPSRNFLDLCDEIGLLVQHEIFDEWDNPKDKRLNQWQRHDDEISRGYAAWFQEEAESDLKNAILRDRNHPSIVQWSIGNEIEWTYPRYKDATGYFDMNAQGNYFFNPPFITPQEIKRRFHESPEGEYVLAKTAKKLSNWVKELDTSRPVTANLILPSASHISGYTDALDIIGYSYRRVVYDYGKRLYPDKMIMGTENVVQWHEWKAVEERDFIAGTFLWTGIDYLGEAHDRWPEKGLRTGMLDTAGFKKSSWHMIKTLWDEDPHIYMTTQAINNSIYKLNNQGSMVASDNWDKRTWYWHDVNRHWNYKDSLVVIEVLTNCGAVEMFLNGDSLGVKRLENNPDRVLKWLVGYSEGVLEARGVGGCEASDILQTAGSPVAVDIEVDRNVLPLDEYSVAHLEVQIVDVNGVPVRHEDIELEFDVPASLQVLGSDNGNTQFMERYQSSRLQTSEGRALLIVRGLEVGQAEIKVRSGGQELATLDLLVR